MTGILGGLRVVEFAQNAAIPHCGRLLAGMGAQVVKIEPPGGDAMRGLAQLGPMEGKAYAVINPGKRSVCLDLTRPDAAEVVEALFRWADVALLAFKLPDLERFGLSWERAKGVNPRLVHLTHSPLGPEGPAADEGGYDALVQGRSGAGFLMNRTVRGAPQASRPAVNDFATGMISALGVVAALRHRDQTGEGQRVDTSLLGTATSLATATLNHFDGVDDEPIAEVRRDIDALRAAGVGFEEQRAVYESRVLGGAGAFRLYFRHYLTSDGLISVGGLSAGLFEKFHAVVGVDRPDLMDPGGDEFDRIVVDAEAVFASRSTAEWLLLLGAVGYPCGPYNLPYEALEDEQIRANDFVVDLQHPTFGQYSTTGMPLQFERAPTAVPGPSPSFAEHTVEVLDEIGLGDRADDLVRDGVVQVGVTEG